jgi:hypothetical protein
MKKSDDAYKSIGEVAKILNLINKKNGSPNTHTIRFWKKNLKISNQEFWLVGADTMITQLLKL